MVGLGSQAGSENRFKKDQTSIPKGIRKMIEKKGLLEASWRRLGTPKSIGGGRGGGDAGATPRKDSGRIRILGKDIIRK